MTKLNVKLLIIISFLLNACGDEGEYIAYEKPEQEQTKTDDGEAGSKDVSQLRCPDKAVAVFAVTVAPAIDSACTSCHVEGQHKLPFYSGQSERNRDALISWGALKPDKLAEFISSNPPHGGGDQSASLPAIKIEQWIDAEKECSGG